MPPGPLSNSHASACVSFRKRVGSSILSILDAVNSFTEQIKRGQKSSSNPNKSVGRHRPTARFFRRWIALIYAIVDPPRPLPPCQQACSQINHSLRPYRSIHQFLPHPLHQGRSPISVLLAELCRSRWSCRNPAPHPGRSSSFLPQDQSSLQDTL